MAVKLFQTPVIHIYSGNPWNDTPWRRKRKLHYMGKESRFRLPDIDIATFHNVSLKMLKPPLQNLVYFAFTV